MNEQISKQDATTGLRKTDCFVFGNGIELEKTPFATTTGETSHQAKDGTVIHILPQKGFSKKSTGVKIFRVHFLPNTSLAQRANDPLEVPPQEKDKIRLDAIQGFLMLAEALKQGLSTIDTTSDEDFYLYADTNPSFADFLRNRCRFRGTEGGVEVWLRKSEFIAEETVQYMKDQEQELSQAIHK